VFAAAREDVERLQRLVEQEPATTIEANVQSGIVTAGPLQVQVSLPPALVESFVTGQWNPTAMLLERFDEVRAVAERLPYLNGF
jgi:3-isopropylmalate/(R)-2-methylmalate dehydratase small subunit